ncbi:MAG: site-specific integrase [Eubacterium sp.]|nr:site-specific integrase [Eubacterium sp.]
MIDTIQQLQTLPAPADGGAPTLNRWFEIWLDTYKRGRVKPTTIDTYTALYNRHIRNSIGDHYLEEFHPIHIQKLYNDFLNKGYSAKYLSTLHALMNSLFKTALANDLVPVNPCSFVDRPSIETPDRRILSRDEHMLLLRQLRTPRFRHIEPTIITLLGTGLRIGELLGLRWEDVHLACDYPTLRVEEGQPAPVSYLTVRRTLVRVKNDQTDGSQYLLQSPKTKCSLRSIPLQNSVVEALLRQRGLQLEYRHRSTWSPLPGFEGLVFAGRHGQPQWRSTVVANISTVVTTINQIEERNADRENRLATHIDRILPHAFRHTFATRCLEAGIPPKVVQHWLGHASIKMTLDLYTHVSKDLSAYHMHLLEASLEEAQSETCAPTMRY